MTRIYHAMACSTFHLLDDERPLGALDSVPWTGSEADTTASFGEVCGRRERYVVILRAPVMDESEGLVMMVLLGREVV